MFFHNGEVSCKWLRLFFKNYLSTFLENYNCFLMLRAVDVTCENLKRFFNIFIKSELEKINFNPDCL